MEFLQLLWLDTQNLNKKLLYPLEDPPNASFLALATGNTHDFSSRPINNFT